MSTPQPHWMPPRPGPWPLTSAGWCAVPEIAERVAGTIALTIAAGWLAGKVMGLVLRSGLAMRLMGIGS